MSAGGAFRVKQITGAIAADLVANVFRQFYNPLIFVLGLAALVALGRPRGRSVDSIPKRLTIDSRTTLLVTQFAEVAFGDRLQFRDLVRKLAR